MRYVEAFVAIASEQFSQTVRFYQALLAQAPNQLWPDKYAEWVLKGGLKLGVFYPQNDHRAEFQADQAGPMSLCFEVENLDAAVDCLTALGFPPTELVQTASHGREVYAYDPEGNRLILHQGD